MREMMAAVAAGTALVIGVAGMSDESRLSRAGDEAASCAAPESEQDRDRWMAAKLVSAQQVFEHLMRGNLEQVETAARRMQVMNFLEQWRRDAKLTETSDYQGQLNAFEFAVKELTRNAKNRDVEGSLRAYVAMSESCVRCHQLIRDVPERR